jgi:hypothetical protein
MENLISQASFQPWRGQHYTQGIEGQRILILGESHYHRCEDDRACDNLSDADRNARHSELTRNVVEWWKDHPHRSPLSHQIPKLFKMEKKVFWESVAFYNYVQAFVGPTARVRPNEELWNESRNAEAFQAVLDRLQPDRILVLGKKLWANLPSEKPLLYRHPDGEPGLVVSNDSGSYDDSDRLCYWYYARSGQKALAMPVMHPAAVRFSASAWVEPVANWMSFGK